MADTTFLPETSTTTIPSNPTHIKTSLAVTICDVDGNSTELDAAVHGTPTTNGQVDKNSPSQDAPPSPSPPPPQPLHVEGKTVLPYPTTTFQIEDHPVDERRQLRVAVIGAGLAGITAGVLLPHKVPGISLKIYEKNSDVGGVWLENTYPGVRCDVPAHVYRSSIEPHTQWTEQFAQGAEIRRYWQETAAQRRGVYEHVVLHSQVTRAEWDEEEAVWPFRPRHTYRREPDRDCGRRDHSHWSVQRVAATRLPGPGGYVQGRYVAHVQLAGVHHP